MEVNVLVWNMERMENDSGEDVVAIMKLPLNEEEVRERLGFDRMMTGLLIDCTCGILEEDVNENMSIEEVNSLYYMLENLTGKVPEEDIWTIKDRWFSSVKEMCDNFSFVNYLARNTFDAAEKMLEANVSSVPEKILKCVDVVKFAEEEFSDYERYLVTPHGVYSFDEPVY